MAWMDDRVWCHPKFTDLSSDAFRAYWCGVAYSAGMGTKGVLTPAQQVLVGATAETRAELENAGLWDPLDASVHVHDWDDHNGKRDARRVADRERKRAARSAEKARKQANVHSRPQDSRVERPQDRRALKEVKEVTTPKVPLDAPGPLSRPERPVTALLGERCVDCGETYGLGHLESCPRMAKVAS